jgi:8-oxo-dGTP pyrophosphatase MutT (NUDIX family)
MMANEHAGGDDATVNEPNDTNWTVTNRRLVYNSPPWLRVDLADVRKPSGQQEEHHLVSLPRAVMVVALDESGERVLLAWRHRWVPDLWSWELPGGLIENDESPEEAAIRELVEETGYHARNLRHLVTYEPEVGTVRSPRIVFRADGVDRVGDPTEHDEGLFRWVRLDTVPDLIARGQVGSSGALIGLLQVLASQPK